MSSSPGRKKLALVLSGGGARGAYEAGIIHYIRTQLPKSLREQIKFDVLCGSSVGAINTCFLAATNHHPEYQGQKVFELWDNLKQENIYRRGIASMTRLLGRTTTGVLRNIFSRSKPEAAKPKLAKFKGLLDTTPFAGYLKHSIPWKQISLNIQNRALGAVTVTTTNIHTGKVELFIDKHPSFNYTGRHPAHFGTIEYLHAMASAAIPILFPTIRINKNYYCDGGMRLNTPMSPAIQLGADKLLVIGLHHQKERAEYKDSETFVPNDVPPTLGEIGGQVLKSLFVDRLDYDLEQLKRINRIVRWSEEVFGADYVDRINAHVALSGQKDDIAGRGIKKLEVMSLFPSVDPRTLFTESLISSGLLTGGMTSFEKILLKILDVDLNRDLDFLSFILFSPAYLKKLLELGFEDARTRHHQLVAYLEGH